MTLLLDIFGFLSVVLRGLTTAAEACTVGGVIFLLVLARPLADQLGPLGDAILRRSYRIATVAAILLAVLAAAGGALELAVLITAADLTLLEGLGADFVTAAILTVIAAATLAWQFAARREQAPALLLAGLTLAILAASVATSHAAARLDDRLPAALFTLMHRLAAAGWIGGLPYFLGALALANRGEDWRRIGRRYSQISMVSVAVLLAGGIGMTLDYIGSLPAAYGTAYGVMVSTKVVLFGVLLLLGAGNFLLIDRLRRDPGTPVLRLRRFVEVELGIGLTVFLAAGSLTSLPPAVDLIQDRVTLQEYVDRLTPHWPRLTSPDHAALEIPRLQAQLDAEAAGKTRAAQAFVPGGGVTPPRNLADIGWSEYNHHWAGVVVLVMGLLAVAEATGKAPWARHWPLAFLGLAVFLFLRSDPENWPLGSIGFWEGFRDPEVVQHRLFVVLISAFAFFEWGVRTGRLTSPAAALVFPLLTAIGGALLLTHSHAIANVKDQLLIEVTHTPLAVFGILAGWSRWLELRMTPPVSRIAGAVWPVCLVLCGLILLVYREI